MVESLNSELNIVSYTGASQRVEGSKAHSDSKTRSYSHETQVVVLQYKFMRLSLLMLECTCTNSYLALDVIILTPIQYS